MSRGAGIVLGVFDKTGEELLTKTGEEFGPERDMSRNGRSEMTGNEGRDTLQM